MGLGSLSAGLSSATLATALTGFGIVASPALSQVFCENTQLVFECFLRNLVVLVPKFQLY